LAILRVNLRPDEERRSPGNHDDDVARGLVQAEQNGTNHLDRSPTDTPTNGNGAEMDSAPIWQKFEWRLMPYTPVGRALVSATQRLEDGESSTASLDAQVILAHVLGVDRSWLFAHYDYQLMPAEATCYSELVARRTAS
jgi:hypothetical protein